MENIVLAGLNHKTAPVEIREKIAFSGVQQKEADSFLIKLDSIKEAVVISTCNRTEIIVFAAEKERAVSDIKSFIAEFKNICLPEFENSLYILTGEEAVSHIFKVCSSLDSMILGEPQILGQVKEAYSFAAGCKASGPVLNRLFHRAFFIAKRIRSETGIGDSAVSVSYAAVELGRKIFGSLEGKKAMLIGAGEMAELAVEHLIRNRVNHVWVANRTFERGLALAKRFKGMAVYFKEILQVLKDADIIISSTGSPEFTVTYEMVKQVMRVRKNRPLFFVDIAVPRDIDPKIDRLNNAYVYDIDDLKGVVGDNIEERKKEAVKADRIAREGVAVFGGWFKSLKAVPTIEALGKKMDSIAKAEFKKTMKSLTNLSEEEKESVCRMTDSIIRKILHEPAIFLRKDDHHGDITKYIDFTRRLFNLDNMS